MFVSRGTGEVMGAGATGALVDVIAEQINGSDIEAIEYPASMEDPLYFLSVANGTALVKEAITTYAAACPGSKVAVFGYSQVRNSCRPGGRHTG
jgi:spore maturation protein SpmB